jgi:soluble lytic murein transglycosylase
MLSLSVIRVYIFGCLLLNFLFLSPSALATPEQAVRQIMDENWVSARETVLRTQNPALYKFYEWSLYRNNLDNLPFPRIAQFIRQHQHWPDQKRLLATAERNMPDSLPAAEQLAWFQEFNPVTGEGLLKMLAASALSGVSVQNILNQSWPTATMDELTQSKIITQYGSWISRQAHEERLDELIGDERYTLARALASTIGNGYPRLVEAIIALREGRRDGDDLLYKVPASLQSNSSLIYERVRALRKNNQNVAAANLLEKLVTRQDIINPEALWKERNVLARRLLEDKNYQRAYRLSSQHGMNEGREYAEAEWFAGWIALRFLDQPERAYYHFTRMYAKVETAISKARGAYWAGRAAYKLGRVEESKTWYYQASTFGHTYYGQIAASQGKIPKSRLTPVPISASHANVVATSDLVQVAVLLHRSGHESLSQRFIAAKIDILQTPEDFQALATYLKRIGDREGAYRVAKQASWKNYFLGDTAYPSLMQWIGKLSIDPALAHAIIRQESQFDTTAESPVGALGLMQLMPATAREVARKRGWEHREEWLTSRPEHNIRLGSAYLNDLLERYDGAYPLAIAAYNAGPSRVNGWLEAFGDPRSGEINWIDWLELIPFTETRNYVQRVTEGLVTYRDHLGLIKK